VKRSVATEHLTELLSRVVAGGFYVDHVRAVFVFGSYAAGRLEVGDIDLDVEYEASDELRKRELRDLFDHRVPHVDFMQALRGSRRGFQIHFNQAEMLRAEPGFDLVPIFARGDTLEQAMARLMAIEPDPSAPIAARDAVTPELAGLEKLVTRPERLLLERLRGRQAISVERLELQEGVPADPETRWRIEHSWRASNPKRRAAFAAAVRLETLGAGELLAGLPGRAPLHDREGRWCAYLGIGAVDEAVQALASGWEVALGVYNVTRKSAPLHALELRRRELSADELLSLLYEPGA
jgi:hypothetical protein